MSSIIEKITSILNTLSADDLMPSPKAQETWYQTYLIHKEEFLDSSIKGIQQHMEYSKTNGDREHFERLFGVKFDDFIDPKDFGVTANSIAIDRKAGEIELLVNLTREEIITILKIFYSVYKKEDWTGEHFIRSAMSRFGDRGLDLYIEAHTGIKKPSM